MPYDTREHVQDEGSVVAIRSTGTCFRIYTSVLRDAWRNLRFAVTSYIVGVVVCQSALFTRSLASVGSTFPPVEVTSSENC